MRQLFSSAQLPAYHSGMLIVRMRSTMGPAAVAAPPRVAASVLGTRGMSALSTFDRGGLIRRVVSLARRPAGATAVTGARRAMSALAASAEPSPGGTLSAGVNLLELERDTDAAELQVALAGDPNVEFVSRVPVRYLLAPPRPRTRAPRRAAGATIAAAPPPPATMWNLAKIRWAEARATAGYQEPTTVRVAVLDTGIDREHPDLVGRVTSYTHQHPDIPDASGERDIIGHGTHVAGTIGAVIGNEVGINGICECELHIWKIFDDVADFDDSSRSFVYFVDPVMYLRALADCVEQRVDVVNLSIGGGGQPDHQEQLLFDTLIANGTTVVAAMGNERQFGSPTSFPAAIPGVIAVGATKLNDSVASFSNRGNHIALSAPGVAIWSTLPTQPGQFGFEATIGPDGRPREGKADRRETDYDAWDGTSMATPHVSAASAVLLANRGRMNSAAVRARLQATADRVPGMGNAQFHPDYGAGRLNLLRLVSEA
jgi:subtilisin family serine protease